LWLRRGKVLIGLVVVGTLFGTAFAAPVAHRPVAIIAAAIVSIVLAMAALAVKVRRYVQVLAAQNQALHAALNDEVAGARHYADLRLTAEARAVRASAEQSTQSKLDKLNSKVDEATRNSEASLQEVTRQAETRAAAAEDRVEAELKAFRNTFRTELANEVQDVVAKLGEFEQRLADLARQSDERLATAEDSVAATNARFGELAEEVRAVRQGLEQRMHFEIEEKFSAVSRLQDERNERVESELKNVKTAVSADTGFLRFNRVLTTDHIATLKDNWTKRLGIGFSPSSLGYMAQRIRHLEAKSNGRLATQIEDAVLRTLVSASSKSKSLEVLEIGSLFGIGLTMIHDFAKHRFDHIHLTSIDPLDGYYDSTALDTLLQIPVNKENFWENMRLAGVPEESVTLIDRFSHEDEAIAEAAKKQYDVLVIDGDHSYGGVKADFENYIGMVKRGGYVIIDDYGSDDWPDVTAYVDNEVIGRDDLGLVGIEWRTAVFRVTRAPEKKAVAKSRSAGSRSRSTNSATTVKKGRATTPAKTSRRIKQGN
jgi:hypothetical protein